MEFLELGISPSIVEQLKSKGITEPTPIQAEVFPMVVSGKAVRILSKTGTGKTFAYVIPLVHKYLLAEMADGAGEAQLKILVVVPTRELAFQVASSFETLGLKEKISVVVGGENETAQIKTWKNAAVAIATPGRLLDLLDRRAVNPEDLRAIVFDEADRLIDMGFIDDIRRIYSKLPKGLQVLFASATMNLTVDEIGYEFGLELERAGVESDELTVENLDHKIAYVGDQEKFHAIANYVAEHQESRGIIFSNYRERAHDIAKRLKGLGWASEAMSAQLNQDQRNSIIESYRNGKTKVLIASDLASRGLDFLDIDYVINYDLPEDPAVYVHRVGRTARAGKKGEAISLIGFNDSYQLEKLESFLGEKIARYDFDHSKLTGPFPRKDGRVQASSPSHEGRRPQSSHSHPGERPLRPDQPLDRFVERPKGRHSGRDSGRDSRPERDQHRKPAHQSSGQSSGQTSGQRSNQPPRHVSPQHAKKPAITASAPKVTLLTKIMSFLGLGKSAAKSSVNVKNSDAQRENHSRHRPHSSRPKEGRSNQRRRSRRPHRGPKRGP